MSDIVALIEAEHGTDGHSEIECCISCRDSWPCPAFLAAQEIKTLRSWIETQTCGICGDRRGG